MSPSKNYWFRWSVGGAIIGAALPLLVFTLGADIFKDFKVDIGPLHLSDTPACVFITFLFGFFGGTFGLGAASLQHLKICQPEDRAFE